MKREFERAVERARQRYAGAVPHRPTVDLDRRAPGRKPVRRFVRVSD